MSLGKLRSFGVESTKKLEHNDLIYAHRNDRGELIWDTNPENAVLTGRFKEFITNDLATGVLEMSSKSLLKERVQQLILENDASHDEVAEVMGFYAAKYNALAKGMI